MDYTCLIFCLVACAVMGIAHMILEAISMREKGKRTVFVNAGDIFVDMQMYDLSQDGLVQQQQQQQQATDRH